MALDTQNKRRSAWVGCGRTSIAPVPDGTIDAQDRAQARWVYAGFLYELVAPEPEVIIVGGDDAPGKKRKKEKPYDLFREIEKTVHALLHPTVVRVGHDQVSPSVPKDFDASAARRAVDELLILAKGQHVLLRRATALQAELAVLEARQRELEQDEEDALMWMF